MPLTDIQRRAMAAVRTRFQEAVKFTYGTAESFEQRSRPPAPGSLPPDVIVRIETAPPCPTPDPILEGTGALKSPERVPVYFFSLRSDGDSDSQPSGADAQNAEDIANTRVIFHIHGGGNVAGHPTVEYFMQYFVQLLRGVASQSGGSAKCVLIAPCYRLATAPENAFPAALQDVMAAYDYILDKGYKSSNVIIAGDSAGGNHAIVMTHLILRSGKPPPHGVVAIAPGSIQAPELLSDHAKRLAERDIIDLSAGVKMTEAYLGQSDISLADPLISGSLLSFSEDWPKTLVLVGDGDVLIDASRELEKRLSAVGRPVELVEYDERPHAWWIMPQVFPENVQDSVERIARFLLQ